MANVLLALHGFHSSPNSLKVKQMSAYLALHHPDITFICPQLPCFPQLMWETIEAIFVQHKNDNIAVMGSSLGGYLATKVAYQYQVKTLLINPAVDPYRLLSHAGEQFHPYTQDNYIIDENYLQQLKALQVSYTGDKKQCWVLLQSGDEVLDHQIALQAYKQCKISCEQGGDHRFIGFDRYLPDIIKFLFK